MRYIFPVTEWTEKVGEKAIIEGFGGIEPVDRVVIEGYGGISGGQTSIVINLV